MAKKLSCPNTHFIYRPVGQKPSHNLSFITLNIVWYQVVDKIRSIPAPVVQLLEYKNSRVKQRDYEWNKLELTALKLQSLVAEEVNTLVTANSACRNVQYQWPEICRVLYLLIKIRGNLIMRKNVRLTISTWLLYFLHLSSKCCWAN